ncbi:hypothetical protein L3C95_11665 [Chitinophaga filiformis]|uniref:hypothetical protein n=1 Tax=Chitinophaga filiformis TaxID=104663 RepID=UPI001F320093|nr:hypothetical protein [Chitinophaga filiformis]MCF6402545.1 hypothetical protein [Chitinophaga filiformis]MCF6403537.1 hypothetical protein [Chitinophaga filiformis]
MKQIFFLLPILLASAFCQAQTDSTLQKDSAATAEKSTLTIGTSYANNANYYGQKADERMAYVAAVAKYQHRSGFSLTGTSYRLLNDHDRVVSAYSAGAGFSFKLSKRLSAELSYNYTFYPKLSPFLQAANPHSAAVGLTHSGWLTTTLGVDYAFGKTNDFFSTLGISKQINLFSLTSKDIVTLTPLIDVTAGTQRFYTYYIQEKTIRDSLLGILPPILGTTPGGGTGSTSTTETTTSYDLLSYNLKLPLAYNRASYMIEVEYQLSLLGQKSQSDPGKANSFFTASFYYQF